MAKEMVKNSALRKTAEQQQQAAMTLKCLMHKVRATRLVLAKYGVK